MNKKIIFPTILFIAVLVFSFFALSQEKNKSQFLIKETEMKKNQSTDQIILFYGNNCPHCAIVEKYIKENNIDDKIPLIQKEVYYNRNNAKELKVKAKICGLPTNSIGVPFLWDGKKCLIGDQNIINFFKEKINNQ